MTNRRPLVLVGNNVSELPSGDAVSASLIANTPAGNIAATDVQAAINELDSEKAATGHTHAQLHDPVTVSDTTSIDLTLTGQQISAAAKFGTTSGTVAEGNHTHAALYQPLDADLTAIAGLTTTSGLLQKTAADTWTLSNTLPDFSLQTVSATLHRSPNAITALFVYDTSKDSDGGAWTEKCQHTSWYNETIYGQWLGAQASESAARAVSGATTNDYFQLTTDGRFYALNAGSGVTEVFRGNKRSFPKLAAIVCDGGTTPSLSVGMTIYDLTEPGRPMWMRLRASGTTNAAVWGTSSAPNTAAACPALNGVIALGLLVDGGYSGLLTLSFPLDRIKRYGRTYTYVGGTLEGIALRHTSLLTPYTTPLIRSHQVGVVELCKQPSASIDPSTGLSYPLIAIAGPSMQGISLLSNPDTVINSASTLTFTQITLTPQLLSAGRADAVWYYAANPSSLGTSFALSTKNASTATDFNVGNTTLLKAKDRANYARTSGAVVQLLRNNEGTIGKGIAAKLSDTYNTGWLAGDIRRAYLANSKTADRSYKGATATETGTVTSAAVNTGNDLVAYSDFSAANYIQESYSADLDFGTGEWSCSAWVNIPTSLPPENFPVVSGELVASPEFDSTTGWVPGNWVITEGAAVASSLSAGSQCRTGSILTPGKAYRITYTITYITGPRVQAGYGGNTWGVVRASPGTYQEVFISSGDSTGFRIVNNTSSVIVDSFSCVEIRDAVNVVSRASVSGPSVNLYLGVRGTLSATAFDGTTTRTVTTTAAYNTATWLKARANYTTDGKLAILVNGVEVASTTGTALLTLNNSNAVLTIGNSYALDAPFPGSIALLKFSASVPTAEQALFMYEQEKHLFNAGAKCVLPASTNVLDLAYDDATDTWSTLQATHEASWSGLVRTSTQTPSAGSFSKTAETSGVQLLGRITTNPGVDVRMPAKNLRPKDMPKDTNQDIVVFDFDALTSQTDFVLPAGYTARVVYSAGAQQREGSTKAWVRVHDGFRETVRFGTAPGDGVWVQIHAVKEVSL